MNQINRRFWVFSGTIDRRHYVINAFLLIGLILVMGKISQALEPMLSDIPLGVCNLVFMLGTFYCMAAVIMNIVKRIRDIRGPGMPVWTWMLGLMVPVVGLYFTYRLLFSKSYQG